MLSETAEHALVGMRSVALTSIAVSAVLVPLLYLVERQVARATAKAAP